PLDRELLLEAGGDALAEVDGVPDRLPAFLVGERRRVGAVGDGQRLGGADALQRLVGRLGVGDRGKERRQQQRQSSHHMDLELVKRRPRAAAPEPAHAGLRADYGPPPHGQSRGPWSNTAPSVRAAPITARWRRVAPSLATRRTTA